MNDDLSVWTQPALFEMSDTRIRDDAQFAATFTARQKLRDGAMDLAGTDAVTSGQREAVWAVVHALATQMIAYQKSRGWATTELD